MQRVRLRNGLGDLTDKTTVRTLNNINGNGNGKAPVAKKTTRTDAADKEPKVDTKVIEAPVVVRVQRTVKAKEANKAVDEKTGVDQVNPGGVASDDPGATEVDLNTIEVRPFVTTPAKVAYNYGISRSLNYQSVTLGVTVEIPCYKEEIEEAIEEAKQICVQHLKKENDKLTAVLDKLVEIRNQGEQRLVQQGLG